MIEEHVAIIVLVVWCSLLTVGLFYQQFWKTPKLDTEEFEHRVLT